MESLVLEAGLTGGFAAVFWVNFARSATGPVTDAAANPRATPALNANIPSSTNSQFRGQHPNTIRHKGKSSVDYNVGASRHSGGGLFLWGAVVGANKKDYRLATVNPDVDFGLDPIGVQTRSINKAGFNTTLEYTF